ncbi:hypothetical protein C8Q74DRAFT_1402078 [Fomes fomentarius]|nr:hypothetical protein C8Q74DRAFT_1402078 [Fomes fomentarius]
MPVWSILVSILVPDRPQPSGAVTLSKPGGGISEHGVGGAAPAPAPAGSTISLALRVHSTRRTGKRVLPEVAASVGEGLNPKYPRNARVRMTSDDAYHRNGGTGVKATSDYEPIHAGSVLPDLILCSLYKSLVELSEIMFTSASIHKGVEDDNGALSAELASQRGAISGRCEDNVNGNLKGCPSRAQMVYLAVQRSLRSLKVKQLSYWKLMLRDGLNLYGAIWVVNMVNMLFWFIITPTGPNDPVRTIVTSMAAVLTASMTMRIILAVRGSLVSGGSFAVSSTSQPSRSGNTTHVISASRGAPGAPPNPVLSLGAARDQAAYAVPLQAGDKAADWDGKSSVGGRDQKGDIYIPVESNGADNGVHVTVESETDFGSFPKEKN